MKKELNFCPYEFLPIDKENQAYELVFPNRWTWERVLKETVVGRIKKRGFISENDKRSEEHFRPNQDEQKQHIILRESDKKGGINGFGQLNAMIKRENEIVEKAMEVQEEAGEVYQSDKPLYHVVKNGLDTYVDQHHNVVMYALPCCPHCHNRLPLGWNVAEDFCAVSLMAPSGSGKTTYLLSMMSDNWKAFQNLGRLKADGPRLFVTPAHLTEDEKDVTYQDLKKASADMCKNRDGNCPDNTDRGFWIPPVFLNIQYDGHLMIMGIYDNAGENLRGMNLLEHPNLQMLQDQMFAKIFLFDPKLMNREMLENGRKERELLNMNCQVLTPKEQAVYQREHKGVRLTGDEVLLRAASSNYADTAGELTEVYDKYLSSMQQNNMLEQLKKKYFFGVIIKSDLLEKEEKIRASRKYDLLFDRSVQKDMLDKNSMEGRENLVEEMIKEFRLFGDKNIDDFKEDFGETEEKQAVSWHCISALGCSADDPKEGGRLKGAYAPIRVAEPLVTCMVKRICENNWLD